MEKEKNRLENLAPALELQQIIFFLKHATNNICLLEKIYTLHSTQKCIVTPRDQGQGGVTYLYQDVTIFLC